jgi:type I restriction-modification system DNA methylase subunit
MFKSKSQEKAFQAVLSGLRQVGYRGSLLQERYSFGDWFQPGNPLRSVPAAGFGYFPPSYENACVAVLVPDKATGFPLVSQYRALGAPLAFEVKEKAVSLWKVGKDVRTTSAGADIQFERIPAVFDAFAEEWSATSILRAKNVVEPRGGRQLEFVDLGLIPALEEQIKEKLDHLFHDVLSKTVKVYRRSTGEKVDEKQLFRLVFRLLAGKVLHDQGAAGFDSLSASSGPKEILRAVGRFYGSYEDVLEDPASQEAALAVLWNSVDFRNLSVNTLAYIYENTLVTESSRQRLGTHSTPSSVARYLVQRLPFEDYPREERLVVEPCSGHCVLLIAAMQRLQQLLPASMTPAQRHNYFVHMLRGYEYDAFALEVGKLCLMLADFPNGDGWRLENKDVFVSRSYTESLKEARLVISNPPFEDFSREEQARYGKLRNPRKPAELLSLTLEHLHPQGSLGFVLPRHFIDGKGYRELREQLARRYREIEVVALPDRIFHVSKAESALLVARSPEPGLNAIAVSFAEVFDRDRSRFLTWNSLSRRDVRKKTVDEAADSFVVPPLLELWKRLDKAKRLGAVAEIHRGIEWKKFDAAVCYSATEKPGYRRGFTRINNNLFAFLPLPTEYLNVDPKQLLYSAIELPWEKPKVVVNAARVSQGPWRLGAFVDLQSNTCSQRFIGVWPLSSVITVQCLAAVLNGPLANAFVNSFERGRDNRITTLRNIPLPMLSNDEWIRLASRVKEYEQVVQEEIPHARNGEIAHNLLLQIDALVLAGYSLPPRLERKLLSYFEGERRPVTTPFEGYDVETFTLYRVTGGSEPSLAWLEDRRTRRATLAKKMLDDTLSAEEDRELSELDRLLDHYGDVVAPLPFDLLERLENEARLDGVELKTEG